MLKQFTPVVCLFDDDGQWYRAQVVSTHGDTITVLFVDFGNTQIIAKKDWTSKAKDPSANLLEKEMIYVPIQDMSLLDDNLDDLKVDLDKIMALIDNQEINWSVVPKKVYGGHFTDDAIEGQIHVNHIPLVDYLNGAGDAPPTASTASSSVAPGRFKTKLPKDIKEVYISSIDPGHLWLTRIDKEAERDQFVAELEAIVRECGPLKDHDIDIGTPCIARSSS